jgi:hypothetical protein
MKPNGVENQPRQHGGQARLAAARHIPDGFIMVTSSW